jgi:hypothetical protein
MPRLSVLTETFIAKCDKEIVKPHATLHTVARKLNMSISTIYRATGGRKAALKRKAGASVARPHEAVRSAAHRKGRNAKSAKRTAARRRRAA